MLTLRLDCSLRIYAIGVADAVGLGIYLSLSALYLKEGVALTTAQVGWVLGVSGIASLFGAMPIARAAQRVGLQRGLCILMVGRAVAYFLLSTVHSLPAALLAFSLTGLMSRGTVPLIEAALIGDDDKCVAMQALARMRMVRTSSIAAGGLPVGFAVWVDAPWAYRAVMASSALLFLLAALLCTRMPDRALNGRRTPASVASVLANRPYIALIAVYGALTLSTIVLGVGLPLWVVGHSAAPSWIVGAFKLLNTLCVIAWQARANRGTDRLECALGRLRTGGVFAAISSAAVLAVGSNGMFGDIAIVLIVVAMFSMGEVFLVAGGQGAALAHIPQGQRPIYMAAFNVGFAGATVIGPLMVTATVAGPSWGWALWSAFFAFLACVVGWLPMPLQHEHAHSAKGVRES
ncbi:hypothetical protein GR157_04350 [Burkholderia sp. 4701]|nr:hypothetical protein [Burkholderia sp. 4701]MXN85377.1 hypothetical protein [Burkholderia sp. 4812]